jgi:hypothetical protein
MFISALRSAQGPTGKGRPLSIYVFKSGRKWAMTSLVEGELPNEARVALQGSDASTEESVELLMRLFPHKPYCLVEQWTIFRADLTTEEIIKVQAANHLPLFLFAHKVIKDSRGRFQPGDWVRSSMAISFDGIMFETKRTLYVLKGPGHEKKADLKTIFSFF